MYGRRRHTGIPQKFVDDTFPSRFSSSPALSRSMLPDSRSTCLTLGRLRQSNRPNSHRCSQPVHISLPSLIILQSRFQPGPFFRLVTGSSRASGLPHAPCRPLSWPSAILLGRRPSAFSLQARPVMMLILQPSILRFGAVVPRCKCAGHTCQGNVTKKRILYRFKASTCHVKVGICWHEKIRHVERRTRNIRRTKMLITNVSRPEKPLVGAW